MEKSMVTVCTETDSNQVIESTADIAMEITDVMGSAAAMSMCISTNQDPTVESAADITMGTTDACESETVESELEFHYETEDETHEINSMDDVIESDDDTSVSKKGMDYIEDFSYFFWEKFGCHILCSTGELSELLSQGSNVFIYLHHSRSPSVYIFWHHVLKAKLIEYWSDNCVCWGFDVTNPSQHEQLDKIFTKIFGRPMVSCYDANAFPMLIGLKLASVDNIWKYGCMHEFQILVHQLDDTDWQDENSPNHLQKILQEFFSKSLADHNTEKQAFCELQRTTPVPLIIERFSDQTLDNLVATYSPSILLWLKENLTPLNLTHDSPLVLSLVLNYFHKQQVKCLSLPNPTKCTSIDWSQYSECINMKTFSITISTNDQLYQHILDVPRYIHHVKLQVESAIAVNTIFEAINCCPATVDQITLSIPALHCNDPEQNSSSGFENGSIKALTIRLNTCEFAPIQNSQENFETYLLMSFVYLLRQFISIEKVMLVLPRIGISQLLVQHDLWQVLLTQCKNLTEICIGFHGTKDSIICADEARLRAALKTIRDVNLTVQDVSL